MIELPEFRTYKHPSIVPFSELYQDLPTDPILRKKKLRRIYLIMYKRVQRAQKSKAKKAYQKRWKQTVETQRIRLARDTAITNGWATIAHIVGPKKALTFQEWVDYGFYNLYDRSCTLVLRKDTSKKNKFLDNILLVQKVKDTHDSGRKLPLDKRKTKAWKVLIDPRPDIPYLGNKSLDWSELVRTQGSS